MLLDELRRGAIRVGEVSTPAPSPFCGELVWKQTNTLMYADDTPPGRTRDQPARRPRAGARALRRRCGPRIDRRRWPRSFQAKLQRTAEGYAPRDSRELLDWVKERVLLPAAEWEALLDACARDSGLGREELLAPLAGKIVELTLGESRGMAAAESLPRCYAGGPRAGTRKRWRAAHRVAALLRTDRAGVRARARSGSPRISWTRFWRTWPRRSRW